MLNLCSTLIEVQRLAGLHGKAGLARFVELAETLSPLVWAADTKGHRSFCGRKYLEYTGAASLHDVRDRWAEFIHPDDRAEPVRRWRRAVATGGEFHAQYRLRRHDGEYRHFDVTALPVCDADGTLTGWMGVSTDIEDEWQKQQASKVEVFRKVAASMAHEVNNPLAAVNNILFMVAQDDWLSPRAQALLQVAEQELSKASGVVQRAMQQSSSSEEQQMVHLGHLLDDVLLKFDLKLLSGKWVLERDVKPIRIRAFEGDLRMVLETLLNNALEAMPDGGRLRVRIRRAHDWKTQAAGVRVSIGDSGEGIRREIRSHIFQPFFSTRGSLRTGVALWSAAELVRRCGGRIRFRSDVRRGRHGTVFFVWLPAENGAQSHHGSHAGRSRLVH